MDFTAFLQFFTDVNDELLTTKNKLLRLQSYKFTAIKFSKSVRIHKMPVTNYIAEL